MALSIFGENVFKKVIRGAAAKFTNITYSPEDLEQPQITFLGATGTVTGSKFLLEYKNKKILVDCGLFQGLGEDKIKNRRPLIIPPKKVDAIILTHAHLDHCGYIPLMVKEGFKGNIYATQASYELCKLVLPDSGYLQEEDAKYMMKRKAARYKKILQPLYTQEDAVKSLKFFKIIRFNDKVKLGDDISFEIVPAGHILGAGIVAVNLKNKKIVFSGDLGRTNDEILRDPTTLSTADYILCETTYGDRTHKNIDTKTELAKIINKTVSRGGNIVVPAFAVGRAQLLLYMIYQLKREKIIPKVPVFVDSPMAIKITHLLDDFASEHKLSENECLNMFSDTKFTSTVDQSKRIFEQKIPSIIISASGMATGGRVLHHIAHYAPDNLNTILLVGFQSIGTNGRLLQDGKKELKIHGQVVRINAEVEKLENMSAHADSDELMDWLRAFTKKPNTLFLVHGELKASDAFAERVRKELEWNVVVPFYSQRQKL
ncbi:MAG: MBL fold metallo-hydrolase [Rickettsiales bacterium]|jgi:metallo-beta-lactamase family protein|nr:MBL fold metallo-hydrolase [Rickettsiales bacterium]